MLQFMDLQSQTRLNDWTVLNWSINSAGFRRYSINYSKHWLLPFFSLHLHLSPIFEALGFWGMNSSTPGFNFQRSTDSNTTFPCDVFIPNHNWNCWLTLCLCPYTKTVVLTPFGCLNHLSLIWGILTCRI